MIKDECGTVVHRSINPSTSGYPLQHHKGATCRAYSSYERGKSWGAASTQRVMRWLISTANVESVVNLTSCIFGGNTGESQSSMQTWREQQKDCAWHFWFGWDSMYHFDSQQAKTSKKQVYTASTWISWPLKYLVARKQHIFWRIWGL